MEPAIMAAVRSKAAAHNIDPALLAAIVTVESGGKPWAVRYEPLAGHYAVTPADFARLNGVTEATERVLQMMSFGLVQVMGWVARSLGFRGPLPELLEAGTGLEMGCLLIGQLRQRFGSTIGTLSWNEDIVASYNAGSPRRREDGTLVNAEYVAKVKAAYREIKG